MRECSVGRSLASSHASFLRISQIGPSLSLSLSLRPLDIFKRRSTFTICNSHFQCFVSLFFVSFLSFAFHLSFTSAHFAGERRCELRFFACILRPPSLLYISIWIWAQFSAQRLPIEEWHNDKLLARWRACVFDIWIPLALCVLCCAVNIWLLGVNLWMNEIMRMKIVQSSHFVAMQINEHSIVIALHRRERYKKKLREVTAYLVRWAPWCVRTGIFIHIQNE